MLLAGEQLSTYVPTGARVGSFNAGIIGYCSPLTVINLDGVNEEAARAIREDRLGDLLARDGIEWLVDFPPMWSRFDWVLLEHPLGDAFRFAPRQTLARFAVGDAQWSGSFPELLQVDWRAAPPARFDLDFSQGEARRFISSAPDALAKISAPIHFGNQPVVLRLPVRAQAGFELAVRLKPEGGEVSVSVGVESVSSRR